jgi:hypothetical protein
MTNVKPATCLNVEEIYKKNQQPDDLQDTYDKHHASNMMIIEHMKNSMPTSL